VSLKKRLFFFILILTLGFPMTIVGGGPSCGTIIVRKEVDWGIGSSYYNCVMFEFSISTEPYSFMLPDGGSQSFDCLPTGLYIIGEKDASVGGWSLYDVDIIDPDGGSIWINPYQVEIDLDAGETITVTFKNRPPDFVIPEAPFGTLIMVVAMLVAFFIKTNRAAIPPI
jgi:hypothetical protein